MTSRYGLFGSVRSSSGGAVSDYRFTGQRQESLGNNWVYDYNGRFYDALIGRFLSADTQTRFAGWQSAPEGIYIARERHVQALRQVDAHLARARTQLAAQAQLLDLLAEELRLAQNALNAVTGEFTSDDLLGVIFSQFCIGK